jgi:uncharacterized protein (TIGR03118 family)
MHSIRRRFGSIFLALITISVLGLPSVLGVSQGYIQHNLVSDLPGMAERTDANLINPWGIVAPPMGPLWISDNNAGVSTVYFGNGRPFPKQRSPLVVSIPPPAGGAGAGAPTGIVFNNTSDFRITNGSHSEPAAFIFATEDGTLAGWNPEVNRTAAILAADKSSSGAVYKGLALGTNQSGNFLFATDFHNGFVAMFDSGFNLVSTFTDSSIPAGFAPFGVRNIGGTLFVTYAKQKPPQNHDDQSGPGNGFVDEFSTSGTLVRRFASNGTLNSPWGLALAGPDFGKFSHALLVGDFGDGRINAFDASTGQFLGQLDDQRGNPIAISGLWGLTFGNNFEGERSNLLFFTAGIEEEAHGLFGTLRAMSGDEEGGDNR